MKSGKTVQISIIIPALDEETAIRALLADISCQSGASFEIILSDGGSTDATCRAAEECAGRFGIPVDIVSAGRGRGIQLNSGAAAAAGEFLLFLHADSRLEDPYALRKGINVLTEAGDTDIAAKFSLRFQRSTSSASLAYFFYESKARLLCAGCTHGDQGLMMHRNAFAKFGPFDEFPQMLAETGLAERIRRNGELRLIPAEIFTSARRFETEGMFERQVVNAILMNCADQEWYEPFRVITEIYRKHGDAERLSIRTILKTVNRLIQDLPPDERRAFWRSTRRYLRRNAWQVPFFMDVRRNFRRGCSPGQGATIFLDWYDRFMAPLLTYGDSAPRDN